MSSFIDLPEYHVQVTPKAVCVEMTPEATTSNPKGKGKQKGKGKKRRYMDAEDETGEEKITGKQVLNDWIYN